MNENTNNNNNNAQTNLQHCLSDFLSINMPTHTHTHQHHHQCSCCTIYLTAPSLLVNSLIIKYFDELTKMMDFHSTNESKLEQFHFIFPTFNSTICYFFKSKFLACIVFITFLKERKVTKKSNFSDFFLFSMVNAF